jgi:hypothetical protein
MRQAQWVSLASLPGRAFNQARLALIREAAAHYGISSGALLRRASHLYLRHGFGFQYALGIGLLDPRVSDDAVHRCVTRKDLFTHQARYNPADWRCLTEDKAVFYAYCKSMGLPVTAPIAVFDRAGGWSADGTFLRQRRDWEQFFDERLPSDFIIKPSLGARGQGFSAYRRQAKDFLDSSGDVLSASMLYDRLCGDIKFSRFIVQDRIRNHPDIVRLTGTDALQTVRLVTWLIDDRIEFLQACFKIVSGSSLHDSFGSAGNLLANIDLDRGHLAGAVGPASIGIETVAVHPVTGLSFDAFQLPDWRAAVDLARRAARLFAPLRTIGWDIALTAEGPQLSEGNAFWDPGNTLAVAPQTSPDRDRELVALMARFKASGRWHRSNKQAGL